MTRVLLWSLAVLVAGPLAIAAGCGEDDSATDAGTDTGGDMDTDTDADTDTDVDADTDVDTDTGPDTDTEDCDLGLCVGGIVIETPADFADVAGCTSTTGFVDINCPSCTDLSGLVCLNEVGGDLWIYDNDSLAHLDDLSNLDSIGGCLQIMDNDILTDLTGLSGINYLSEYLEISVNDSLTHLDGLHNISLVDCYSYDTGVLIYGNDALTSLDGLDSLYSMSEGLQVNGNAALPDCEVCELVNHLWGSPDGIDVHDNFDDACTPVPGNCELHGQYCPSYTGEDACCTNDNPCDWELNDVCDCDSTCAWDAVDCEW